ncbi:MAG: hypothetical protein ACYDHU_06520 [Acidimicrobiales bacterium]
MAEVSGAAESERRIEDTHALDMIAYMLTDPEWGIGMLEDIADFVRSTGRSMDNPTGVSTWDRH